MCTVRRLWVMLRVSLQSPEFSSSSSSSVVLPICLLLHPSFFYSSISLSRRDIPVRAEGVIGILCWLGDSDNTHTHTYSLQLLRGVYWIVCVLCLDKEKVQKSRRRTGQEDKEGHCGTEMGERLCNTVGLLKNQAPKSAPDCFFFPQEEFIVALIWPFTFRSDDLI